MTNSRTPEQPLRRLARLTDGAFARAASSEVRDGLLAAIVDTPPVEPTSRRPRSTRSVRRRVRVTVAVTAGAMAAGGAIAWAVVSSGATDTVSVQCEIDGTDTVIPATSGDPVADCAAQWTRDTGHAAPSLRAYDNGHGGVTVAPVAQTPPAGSTPLTPGTVQNLSAITLQETLDDYVAGLNASCHTAAGAVAFVHAQLDAGGLSDWSVQPPPEGGDGSTTCADTAIVDAKSRTVLLRALSGPQDGSAPYLRLADKLRGISGCLTAGELADRVRSAAQGLGLSEAAHDYELTQVAGPGSCAVVHETVGGTTFLTVRGPAR